MNLGKRFFTKLEWVLSSQLGINLSKMYHSIRGLPDFFYDLKKFKSQYHGKFSLMPCLADRFEEGGSLKNEYFWQDLLVAQLVFKSSPEKHIDVGSKIDGFVAHVASFREIQVLDVRPISPIVPNVVFRKADLTKIQDEMVIGLTAATDSLSCLHALEHFGLGRYGDEVNVLGYEVGLVNLCRILKMDGTLYLSIPIGIERVEFNANRVFNPLKIISFCQTNGLQIQQLTLIRNDNIGTEVEITNENLVSLANQEYNLGLFIFKKYQDNYADE